MSTSDKLQTRITELEQEVNRLQIENEQLRVDTWLFHILMDSVPDFIYFKDRNSRFITASNAHAKSFGLQNAEEMVGKTDFDFFTAEHAQPAFDDEQRIIATDQPITLEERETRPDGSVTWVMTTKMPLRREGEIVGTFGISKDITERKQKEEEVQALNATLEARVQERTAELERELTERRRMEKEHTQLQQQIIDAQKQALQELATPIIPILEGILVMPLIGNIDSQRAVDTTRALLAGITQHRAKIVILDITGVPFIDTSIASHLNRTIQAARLKGTRILVTGISDAVAETIVDLGIDWREIDTMRDLQSGLLQALRHVNLRISGV